MKRLFFSFLTIIAFLLLSQKANAQWTTSGNFVRTEDDVRIETWDGGSAPFIRLFYDNTGDQNWDITHDGNLLIRYGLGVTPSMSTKFTFTTAGKFGIGTTPNKNLEIYGQAFYSNYGTQRFLDYDPRGSYSVWDIVSTGSNLHLYYGSGTSSNPSTSSKFYFSSGGTFYAYRFTDRNNGSYYLDPASTSTSIKVAGKIQTCGKIEAEEIQVMNICAVDMNLKFDNAADYVFGNDYSLKSIAEVEKFIKENNHLPGIPSADEFKEDGMDVAQMTNLLLEKIEELTLYTIQLQKEIEDLKSGK